MKRDKIVLKIYIVVINISIFISCGPENMKLCESIEDNQVKIEGILDIDSKDRLVIEIGDAIHKTYLIACTEKLKEKVIKERDFYIYNGNFDHGFWIIVWGKYKNTNSLSLNEFVFDSYAISESDKIKKHTD